MNRGSRENKFPTGTEMRVAKGSWESLGLHQGLVEVAENQVARPMNLGLVSFRLFRTILCLLPGASVLDMVHE